MVDLQIAPVKREEDEDKEKCSVDVDTTRHPVGLSGQQSGRLQLVSTQTVQTTDFN